MAENLSNDVAAIYLNTPHNPTGCAVPKDDILSLAALAERYRLELIVDAVYEDYVFDGLDASIPRLPHCDHFFLINSVSKNYGSPGLRIGWVVASKKNIDRLTGVLERECVAVCSIAQSRAADVLENGNVSLVHHVERNRKGVFEALRSVRGGAFASTSAGTQVMLQCEVDDIEAFADYSLSKYGLILATARNYANIASQSVRIPLGDDPRKTSEGIKRLSDSLQAYADDHIYSERLC
ncbi:hypothetical protein NBRC116584_30000 [Hydrogenophaga sp. 5NK40-0174]